MADLFLKNPKTGAVEIYDEADGQSLANAGYTEASPEEAQAAQAAYAATLTPDQAVSAGVVQSKPFEEGVNTDTGLSQSSEAFLDIVKSGATFGLGADRSPEARAAGLRFREEHPGQAMGAELLGQLPASLAGGAAGSAVRGAAAGAGLLARGGALAADFGLNAAIGGAQIEAEQARMAGEQFSFTDAAIAGVTTEALGRGSAWALAKGVGGARNLISKAARNAAAEDAERSLSKGGWLGDHRVAQHAEAYGDELADLGARDLDTLETAMGEVGRQDRKRARIMRAVIDNPAAQHEINLQAIDGMQRLRDALADELVDASGPAKRLAKQLDERLATLETAPKGRKLWKALDENRQALQEYAQDLHQAYNDNPGSAWLSRESLSAIDAAEEATRNALLREDAWGEAAARMQREYNVPFHEQWFPARKTVLGDLHFASGKDAQGFTVYRGEPGKVRKFLKGLGGTAPDVHRVREQFTQYLSGAEAIAKAGQADAPKAAREALEAIRRLRKNMANSTFINEAVERTGRRAAAVEVAEAAVGGALGAAVGGPIGGAAGVAAVRGAHLGQWLSKAVSKLGLLKGEAESMAKLLSKGALPEALDDAAKLSDGLLDDLAEAPFPKAVSARPPAPAGPIRGQGGIAIEGRAPETLRPGYRIERRLDAELTPGFADTRPNPGADVLPEGFNVYGDQAPARESVLGVGQARRAAADRPAGMDAIQPMARPVDVGGPAPARVPDERPTLQNIERSATERPDAGGAYHQGAAAWDPHRAPESRGVWSPETEAPPGRLSEAESFIDEGPGVRESELYQGPTPSQLEAAVAGERETFPAPYRTEGAADLEARLAPGAADRAVEAARMAALTEGEFADVVKRLDATGAKAPDGTPLGRFLEKNAETLKTAGLIAIGAGGTYAASQESGEGVAAAGVAGMVLLGKRNLGESMLLGGPWALKPDAARRLVKQAIEDLPPPPVARQAADGISDIATGRSPGLKELHLRSAEAEKRLTKEEAEAMDEWVMSSTSLRNEQRTGLPLDWKPAQAKAFEEAADKLTVMNPTRHGELYRHMDLSDEAVADLLTRDEFVAGAHMSTGYVPDSGFGAHQLRFTKVDSAASLMGSNMHETEMLIPKDARFKVTGRYADPDTGNFVFTLEEIPTTKASPIDVGFLALPVGVGAAAAASGGDGQESGAAGASVLAFGRSASLFKGIRGKLVADVARKLFSPTAGRILATAVSRQYYTRAELAKRQQEFSQWADNPQELVDRVAEGFRDVPPDKQPEVHAAIFRAATFLKERLPTAAKPSPLSMRQVPVSTEQMNKFARYEQAALDPRAAWTEAAQRGHVTDELLETTEALHPDLLAEIRVGAYLTVREEGAPPTIQAKLQYAKLFDGDGSLADPALAPEVANMALLAYENAPATKAGGGPTSSGNVSHVAAASAQPAGLAKVG